MSEVEKQVLKALETKLLNLVRCVVDKAAVDEPFRAELEKILLTDSLSKKLREKGTKGTNKRPAFQPVAFLHEHGMEELRRKLDDMTDHDLRVVVRSEGIRKGKEVRTLERAVLIQEIMDSSTRRLQQGSSFLR
jgi:hypothetical protein